MDKNTGYSRDLDQHYTVDEEKSVLIFDDGTVYSLNEAVFIAQQKLSGDDLRAIHLVKNVFSGELERTVRRPASPPDPFDMISVIGMKYGPLPILGRKAHTQELQRRIDTHIRKRKGIEECQQTKLDL